MNWEWLFGKEEVVEPEPPCQCEAPVFEGTTAELLALQGAMQAEQFAPMEEETMQEEAPVVGDGGGLQWRWVAEEKLSERDLTWLNVDLLKMALEIETSKTQRMAFYIDVGNLPKAKAEQYVKDIMAKFTEKDGECKPGHFWLPRREGGRGTEVTVVPGRVTLESVMETAQKLKDFVTAK